MLSTVEKVDGSRQPLFRRKPAIPSSRHPPGTGRIVPEKQSMIAAGTNVVFSRVTRHRYSLPATVKNIRGKKPKEE
jgi:hypothetical protein